MARIRSIKPEFWTDPDIVAMPMEARLFFVGCWNHADDYGVMKDDPARLRLQIMPADQIDAEAIVAELVERRHLVRMTAPDGTAVLVVRSFTVHQKIDRRAVGRWGHPDDFTPPNPPSLTETPPVAPDPALSPPIPTDSTPGLEGRGLEGNGGNPMSPEPATGLAIVPMDRNLPDSTGDVGTVFAAWIDATGKRSGQVKLTPERRRLIQNRLRDYPVADLVDAVRGWRHSAHHRGENDRGTVYNDLELLLRNAKQVETFRDLERTPPEARPKPVHANSRVSANQARIAASLARAQAREA